MAPTTHHPFVTALILPGMLAWGTLACGRGKDSGEPPVDPPKHDVGGGKPDVGGGKPEPTEVVRRYVALMQPEMGCVEVANWSVRPLFRHGLAGQLWQTMGDPEQPGGPDPTRPMPLLLERFCVYTWAGSGAPEGVPTAPQIARADPDPDVLLPQLSPSAPSLVTAEQSLAESHYARMLDALGAKPALDADASPFTDAEQGQAYLALIDTVDSTEPSSALPSWGSTPSTQHHGLAMGALAQAIRCPLQLEACRARQFFVQAFPDDRPTPQPAAAGRRGSAGSLAHAIGEAVVRWQSLDDAEAPLVINMSVGFDLGAGDPLPADAAPLLDPSLANASVPATVQAVYTALAWASCEGAVSIAAAGNNRGRTCEERHALAPAAWECRPAPSPATCGNFGDGPPVGASPRLVYAVGGLDGHDAPLLNARGSSMPGRATYALAAPALVDGPSYTDPWTGTSVAAVALSSIVARAWSYRNTDPAAVVMSTVDAQGAPLNLQRDLCPQLGQGVHRIDGHSVMEAFRGSYANPYLPRSADLGQAAVDTAIGTFVTAANLTAATAGPITMTADPAPTCAPFDVTAVGPSGVDTASAHEAGDLNPALRPQPHVPICPNCPITAESGVTPPEYVFTVKIGNAYQSMTLSEPSLTFRDENGDFLSVALGDPFSQPTSYALSRYVMPGGSSQTVAQWLAAHTDDVNAARFSLLVADGTNPPQVLTDVVEVVH